MGLAVLDTSPVRPNDAKRSDAYADEDPARGSMWPC